jgi:hypothetical protein
MWNPIVSALAVAASLAGIFMFFVFGFLCEFNGRMLDARIVSKQLKA